MRFCIYFNIAATKDGTKTSTTTASATATATTNSADLTTDDNDNGQEYSSLFIKNLNFSTTETNLRDHLIHLGVEGILFLHVYPILPCAVLYEFSLNVELLVCS